MADSEVDRRSPGDIRWARIRADIVYHHNSPVKRQPVVLVRPTSLGWHVAGLTRSGEYKDGNPRRPVPNPTAIGLKPGTSYLWGGNLAHVPHDDIQDGRRLGRADTALLDVLTETMDDITGADVAAMAVGATTPPPPLTEGDICWARVRPRDQRPSESGTRPRAVVLVERAPGGWRTLPLTTHGAHPRSGSPRVELPDPAQMGFRTTGALYFFGNVVKVNDEDLVSPIGHVTAEGAAAGERAIGRTLRAPSKPEAAGPGPAGR